MRREGYLNASKKEEGIREKLDKCLKERGIGMEEVGRVYLVTMPSYLGFMGINPLSVYYCYEKEEDGEKGRTLKVVVLEVHNTFGERHIYVLQCGIEEDDTIAASYVFWTRFAHCTTDDNVISDINISGPFLVLSTSHPSTIVPDSTASHYPIHSPSRPLLSIDLFLFHPL